VIPRILLPCLTGCLLIVATGCGSGGEAISRSDFERMPRESRQEIFDAENDVVVAHNHQDDAQDRKEKAELAVSKLGERWKRTSTRLNASGQAAKISQAQRVFDAEAAYLGSEIKVADAESRSSEVETKLSRARLALVCQRQLVRIGRATTASLKPMEEDVNKLEATLKDYVNATNAVRTQAESQLKAWKSAEDDYARASNGDFDTIVWSW